MKKKINLKKLKIAPFFIVEHAFCACLLLFILSLGISLLLFYFYSSLAEKQGEGQIEQTYFLKQEPYQNVLSFWEKHEEIFQQADSKEYLNPFLEPID